MVATFWIFDKRQDSTAIPTSTGTKITVVLKEGSDLDHPVFKIHTKTLLKATYMLWDGSYYFITGREYICNEYYEISCDIDALATCRSQIMSSSQYVLRSTVSPDYTLIDSAYPTKSAPTVHHNTYTCGTDSTGHYVLMTVSGSGIKYYAMLPSEFETFLSTIYGQTQDDLWSTIESAQSSMVRNFLNVDQYILGCRWVPYPKVITGITSHLKLGYWDTGVTYDEYLSSTSLTYNTKTITLYPTTTASKNFMNCSAYHSLQLFIPGCGSYPVDYAKLKGAASCKVIYKVDCLGNITGGIYNSDDEMLTSISGSLGQDVPVSSRSMSFSGGMAIAGGLGNMVSALAGWAGGAKGAVDDILEATTEIISGAAASVPDVSTKGSIGSYNYEDGYLLIHALECIYDIPVQAPTQQGYPCMKVMTLGTSGFYMIKNPQVDFGDDLFIKNQIEGYMARGFYVE